MRVITFDRFELGALSISQRPEPQPGPGQVLLKMRAWSLNYRDLLVVKGLYNPRLKFPFVPLSDGVGEVVAVGPGVKRVAVGARVAGCFMQDWQSGEIDDSKAKSALGGALEGLLAEYVVLSESGVIPVPAHLSDEEAATLPCAAVTAWHALVVEGQVKAGDSVLIQGTGGVSLFALQFAKMHGARVIATSSQAEKLSRTISLGASDGINYKEIPEWGDKVRSLSGNGVDHVIEVGGAGTLNQSLRAVRTGGRIALIGVLAGPGNVNTLPMLMKNIRLQGVFVGSREMFEAMNRAIALHQMRPIIDHVFPFTEIQQALHHLESGQHFGKVCLRI